MHRKIVRTVCHNCKNYADHENTYHKGIMVGSYCLICGNYSLMAS